jgi:hypothetical protein
VVRNWLVRGVIERLWVEKNSGSGSLESDQLKRNRLAILKVGFETWSSIFFVFEGLGLKV